jgi:RNA polymerase sigma factor (sigma-70 family)
MTATVHSGAAGWIARAWAAGSAPAAARAGEIAASTDEALVASAVAGSPAAFGRLVERHQQALRAFLRRICGDWAQADDLAQETFLTAWSRLGKLTPGADVGAWLCGIGYNKCLTVRRGVRRARERETLWNEATGDAGGCAPEDRLALKAAMADLPLEQRACVALCLAAGLSHGEAAKALGLPLGTVKSHVTRGRARILSFLGEAR